MKYWLSYLKEIILSLFGPKYLNSSNNLFQHWWILWALDKFSSDRRTNEHLHFLSSLFSQKPSQMHFTFCTIHSISKKNSSIFFYFFLQNMTAFCERIPKRYNTWGHVVRKWHLCCLISKNQLITADFTFSFRIWLHVVRGFQKDITLGVM